MNKKLQHYISWWHIGNDYCARRYLLELGLCESQQEADTKLERAMEHMRANSNCQWPIYFTEPEIR